MSTRLNLKRPAERNEKQNNKVIHTISVSINAIMKTIFATVENYTERTSINTHKFVQNERLGLNFLQPGLNEQHKWQL